VEQAVEKKRGWQRSMRVPTQSLEAIFSISVQRHALPDAGVGPLA
jgi:hypothetical protein